MGEKIIICGANGAGKSTLGAYLAGRLGWMFRDIEDYCFPGKGEENPYGRARSADAVRQMLLADLERHENLILAAVKGDFGPEITPRFTRAIWVDAPRDVRLARVRERLLRRFGERMLPGGDLYEQEARFLQQAARRDGAEVEEWLRRAGIETIRVDGTREKEDSAARIIGLLR